MKKHNRRYKDSVFVDLFGEDKNAKENFLSLYNALHRTHLDGSTELKPLRLDNVMYMSFCNDVSCLIDNKIIVLSEHQSTINDNMPVRFLEYAARLYEQIQNPRDRYLRKLKQIPTPEFYVFYNGEEKYLSQTELRLSDAFSVKSAKPSLELVVKVININYNKANGVLKRCKPLQEYTQFVEAVRRHIRLDAENGFKNAIKECIQNDILRDYLERKSREVMNMLIAEYDYDTDIAVQREEEREIAFADGSRQKALETAKAFKRLGFDIAKIADGTGLSVEEIERL
ncbi:Rpn family recombination-promoting nuclease/putative transposase [Treponema maltophilum]|uniref:Rpn family recombination-promoting nuclease/putative transposase n=1 Tax=Treponema maltophilum TaxID=51160 RepID=UPI003D94376E